MEYLSKIKDAGQAILAVFGAIGLLWSGWTSSGMPVPVTLAQVDKRIAVIVEQVRQLKADILASQRATIRLSKNALRNEKTAIERVLDGLDPVTKATMTRRTGEIADAMADLESQDAELVRNIRELRGQQ